MSTYRILVTGSREWTDEGAIDAALRHAALTGRSRGFDSFRLVHGAARGADTIADIVWTRWHQTDPKKYLEPERHPVTHADWERFGKSAGHRRNAEMVRAGADIALAFQVGRSPGTRSCLRMARGAGIPAVLHRDTEGSSRAGVMQR